MREYEIEALIVALERAREHAIKSEMDAHIISEIDHLVVTAQHNREEISRVE